MSAFEWSKLLGVGLKHLGLSPAEFWALTPAEFSLIVGRATGPAPMTRGGLDALLRSYPDAEEGSLDE